MKRLLLTAVLVASGTFTAMAQNPYLVKTQSAVNSSIDTDASPDQAFISENFRFLAPDQWTPGMKFMVMPNRQDLIISTFKDVETGKAISNGELKFHIMEYQGSEEPDGKHARFNFLGDDGKSYYFEVKYTTVANYSAKAKGGVPTLAYLGDVDTAKELLVGQPLYTRTDIYYQDDPTSSTGTVEVKVPKGTKVTVTAVGVGTREYPVKIIFRTPAGKECFQNVAISKTNCGLRDDEFIMTRAPHYFSNAFGLSDPSVKASANLMARYQGKAVYTKRNMRFMVGDGDSGEDVRRYTQMTIKSIKVDNNSKYTKMTLSDSQGKLYSKLITFTRQSVIGDIDGQHEDYFTDAFGLGNLRSMYPHVSDATWEEIANGRIRVGMTRDEVRMAKENPIRIDRNTIKNGEVWFYEDHTIVEFQNGKVKIIK